MPVRCLLKRSTYYDSVALMQAAREVARLPGVAEAAVVMATAANLALLRQAGLVGTEIATAGPNDLVIAVRATDEAVADQALRAAEQALVRRVGPVTAAAGRPRALRAAHHAHPESNLAVISVPGPYAAAEAWEALRLGLHVFLFSDNVPLEEEIALKRYAAAHGLLMMGPGCGTAILDGVALGFGNVLPRGPIGMVSAAGTGLQEVSTILARKGLGLSQGIGTGGRDLSAEVGGVMMRQGLRLLQDDPKTQVLVLISKPPAPRVAASILSELGSKPAVVCFLGGDAAPIAAAGAIPARTLEEAAERAAALLSPSSPKGPAEEEIASLQAHIIQAGRRLQPGQRYLRGLYSGGTLCAEAQVIWQDMGLRVYSNAPLHPALRLADAAGCRGHYALDLGEEEYTLGRPHPMIDLSLRLQRLREEAADPEVAAIVLDVVLGYGAHPDPAGELGPAIYQARAQAAHEGRELLVLASVTGTEEDPQRYSRQVRALEQAGAVVAPSNAAAARLVGGWKLEVGSWKMEGGGA